MGGFTRPRDLRSSNWFPGGRYLAKGKVYESPSEAAYEPHTVYLLESRYHVKHGVGRVDTFDHVVGVCREGDFEAVLKRYNSERAPRTELEYMDNARWPWGPQFQLKRTKWWAAGENPRDIIKELFSDEQIDAAYLDETGKFEEFEEEIDDDTEDPRQPKAKPKQKASYIAPTASPLTVEQKRAFHSSPRLLGSHSYNEDHIVPDFYVQHKRRKNPDAIDTTAPSHPPSASVSKSRQGGAVAESLMEHLSDSILSDEVAATTMRRPKGKIPHEHYNSEGILIHPSGYVIPTPGEAPNPMSERRSRDHGKQTAAVAERVQEQGDYKDFNAHTRLHDNKVPYEVIEEDGSVSHPSGFVPPTPAHEFKYSDSSSVDNHVQDGVQRQRRRSTAVHLSKEEMAEKQRKSDAIFERDEDDAELIAELKAGLEKVADMGNQKRGIHTSAIVNATEITLPPTPYEQNPRDKEDAEDSIRELDHRSMPPHLEHSLDPIRRSKKVKFPKPGKAPKSSLASNLRSPTPADVHAVRSRYLPTLAETPFWRPLLSITLSTRPLAVTLARLSRSLPRGLPFYASISNDDRKTRASFSDRMRNLRIDRMENLTVEIAQLLAGARGGFIGIRFGVNERGRGIGGEGLEAPLPKENRTIKIGVGNWYRRADEVKEAFREDAITQVGEIGVGLEDIGDTFEIAGLDDHGRRIDDKTGEVIPWRESKARMNLEFLNELNLDELDVEHKADSDELDVEAKADSTDKDVDIVDQFKEEIMKRRQRKLRKQALARSYGFEIATYRAQKHRAVVTP